MKTTNTTTDKNEGGLLRSEQQAVNQQRKYTLWIGDECYGFVHANTEAEALDRVAAFKRPFKAVLAENQ